MKKAKGKQAAKEHHPKDHHPREQFPKDKNLITDDSEEKSHGDGDNYDHVMQTFNEVKKNRGNRANRFSMFPGANGMGRTSDMLQKDDFENQSCVAEIAIN